jgi:nucleotide-binding universal stress UspA family protein
MKTFLFPTDFSANADHALDYAVYGAQASNGKIIILNVYFAIAPDIHLSPTMMQELIDEARRQSEKSMTALSDALQIKHPWLQFETRCEHGFAVDNICGLAEAEKVDYIVMGTKGASNMLDKMIGSTASAVIQAAKQPVWVIPQSAKEKQINQILYAADFEGEEKKTIEQVLDFATCFEAETHIVHITEEFEPHIENAAKQMELLKETLHGSNVTFRNLNRADAEEAIETYIQNQQPDVLVVAPHQRGYWASLFHQSMTRHFTLTSKIPLLAIKKI